MSAEAALFTRTWKGGRRTCTLTVPPAQPGQVRSCVIEWDPSVPTRLTASEQRQYKAGRNAALAELAQHLGGKVALLEV